MQNISVPRNDKLQPVREFNLEPLRWGSTSSTGPRCSALRGWFKHNSPIISPDFESRMPIDPPPRIVRELSKKRQVSQWHPGQDRALISRICAECVPDSECSRKRGVCTGHLATNDRFVRACPSQGFIIP